MREGFRYCEKCQKLTPSTRVCEVVWCSVEKVLPVKFSLRVFINFSKKFNVYSHYKCYKILEKCPSTKQLRKLVFRKL
jgi:hypothetical protein